MLIIDRTLAQRLESTDALHTAEYAHQRASLFGTSTAVEKIQDGWAVYAGDNMPVNRVVGLGLEKPVTHDTFDAIEAFYGEYDAPVMLDFCPLADSSLLQELNTQRYYPYKMYTVLARAITAEDVQSKSTIVRTELAEDETLWVKTVSEGFSGVPTIDKISLDDMNTVYSRTAFHHTDGANFMAFINSEPAGSGAMYVNANAGVAELYSASTRVQFRRRGVQTALIQARLAHAYQAECDVAMVMTTPGSASELSLQRMGFQVAYTKLVFTRD